MRRSKLVRGTLEEAKMALTGRFDFRKTLLGKLVLLVEEDVATSFARLRRRGTKRRWRRARVLDLAAPEMRHLIDLRLKPSCQAPHRFIQPSPIEPLPTTGVPEAEQPNGDGRMTAH
jgi:hypothetical protein